MTYEYIRINIPMISQERMSKKIRQISHYNHSFTSEDIIILCYNLTLKLQSEKVKCQQTLVTLRANAKVGNIVKNVLHDDSSRSRAIAKPRARRLISTLDEIKQRQGQQRSRRAVIYDHRRCRPNYIRLQITAPLVLLRQIQIKPWKLLHRNRSISAVK